MQMTVTVKYPLTPVRMTIIKNKYIKPTSVGKEVEKVEFLPIVVGYVKWYKHFGSQYRTSCPFVRWTWNAHKYYLLDLGPGS